MLSCTRDSTRRCKACRRRFRERTRCPSRSPHHTMCKLPFWPCRHKRHMAPNSCTLRTASRSSSPKAQEERHSRRFSPTPSAGDTLALVHQLGLQRPVRKLDTECVRALMEFVGLVRPGAHARAIPCPQCALEAAKPEPPSREEVLGILRSLGCMMDFPDFLRLVASYAEAREPAEPQTNAAEPLEDLLASSILAGRARASLRMRGSRTLTRLLRLLRPWSALLPLQMAAG